jgi:hypothetical protein
MIILLIGYCDQIILEWQVINGYFLNIIIFLMFSVYLWPKMITLKGASTVQVVYKKCDKRKTFFLFLLLQEICIYCLYKVKMQCNYLVTRITSVQMV